MIPTRSDPRLTRGSLRANDLGYQAEFRAPVELLYHFFPLNGNIRTDVGNTESVTGRQIVERQQRVCRAGAVEEDIGMFGCVSQQFCGNGCAGRDNEIRFGDRTGRSP